MPVAAGARDLLGDDAIWFERWLEHPRLSDPFWAPLQCGAALQRTTVPTLLVGGWQDLFIEQCLEQYRALAARECRPACSSGRGPTCRRRARGHHAPREPGLARPLRRPGTFRGRPA